jgi:ferredoxin
MYLVGPHCTGCGTCARVCPIGAIRMVKSASGERPHVNLDICTVCEACMTFCPMKSDPNRKAKALKDLDGGEAFDHPKRGVDRSSTGKRVGRS